MVCVYLKVFGVVGAVIIGKGVWNGVWKDALGNHGELNVPCLVHSCSGLKGDYYPNDGSKNSLGGLYTTCSFGE